MFNFWKYKPKNDIINEIIEIDKKDPDCIISMVKDRFANYVIQKMIEHSDSNTQQKFIRTILSKQNKIKNDGFSKHVLNYIEKLNNINSKNKYKGNNNLENRDAFNRYENKSFK